ncbi:MAG: PDZ domain-containing protein [Clostridia bacterium]|nr:PDZ domain-containing protein [Clostridia bacterium]
MQNHSNTAIRRARIAVVVAAAVLAALLTCIILVSCLSGTPGIASKDEIIANIAAAEEKEGHTVIEYLNDFGISRFNPSRFVSVELNYAMYYYKTELPTDLVLAKGTASAFLEYFYDNIDLNDKTVVTAALINCYVYALGDTYGVYRLPAQYEDYEGDMSGEFVGIGVEIEYNQLTSELKISYVMEDSGAKAAGLLAGDFITHVDGEAVTDIGVDGATNKIRGEAGTTVEVTVLRGTEELTFTVTRSLVVNKTVRYSVDENKIAYIQITSFKDNTDELLEEALDAIKTAGAVGVVFDLRSNPGGYLDAVLNALDLLVGRDLVLATYFDRIDGKVTIKSATERALDLPMVVLCNENTASAGELFTAAVRDFAKDGVLRATTVGTTTYGKGVMQSTFPFPDGAALTMTIAYYNPPCDVNFDGIGVIPEHTEEDPEAQLALAYSELMKLIDN